MPGSYLYKRVGEWLGIENATYREVNPYGFDTKNENLFPSYQFYDVDIDSIKLGIVEREYPRFFLRRHQIFYNRVGRIYKRYSVKLDKPTDFKMNSMDSLISQLESRGKNAFKRETNFLSDALAQEYRKNCTTIKKRVDFWTNYIFSSNQLSTKKNTDEGINEINIGQLIVIQALNREDFFRTTRKTIVGNKILRTSEIKGGSLSKLVTSKGVKKDLTGAEKQIIDSLSAAYVDSLNKEVDYLGSEAISSYISDIIVNELNKGVKQGLFYSVKKGNKRASKKKYQGFKDDFKKVMENVEKEVLEQIKKGKVFRLKNNDTIPVFSVEAKLAESEDNFFTSQFTLSGVAFKETGIADKDLRNMVNVFSKSFVSYFENVRNFTFNYNGEKMDIDSMLIGLNKSFRDITVNFVSTQKFRNFLLSEMKEFFKTSELGYSFLSSGYFSDAAYKGMLAELASASTLYWKGLSDVKVTGNEYIKRNGKNISKKATDISASSFKIDKRGKIVTNDNKKIHLQIKNLKTSNGIVNLGKNDETSSIFSSQIYTYFNEEDVKLMRFVIANYEYVKEVLQKASDLIDKKRLKQDLTILAYKNIDNFLRIKSITDEVFNDFFVINGLYFPSSAIYDLLAQQMSEATESGKEIIEPIIKKNPEYQKFDSLEDTWKTISKDETRFDLTKNNFWINNIRSKSVGIRFRFKGVSIDLNDLL